MARSPAPTRVTLFGPGDRRLERAGVAGEWIDNPKDGSFAAAFSFGTVARDVVEQLDAAPGALLVKSSEDLREGRQQLVALVEKLRQHGALAVRFEQSKLGWTVDGWLELVAAGHPWELHHCAVTMLVGKTQVVSCGMHAFSLPDARVELKTGDDPAAAQELLSQLNVYQLAEDPLLLSGQTFSPDVETPRRVLQRWPDDGYPPDHWCHNPYGVWRLGPPGGKGRPQPELHLQFMPGLVVLLAALEEKHGPLTKAQVLEARDSAVCMAVEHRDAQKLERSRGYADLDPELAWEQWQLDRASRR